MKKIKKTEDMVKIFLTEYRALVEKHDCYIGVDYINQMLLPSPRIHEDDIKKHFSELDFGMEFGMEFLDRQSPRSIP